MPDPGRASHRRAGEKQPAVVRLDDDWLTKGDCLGRLSVGAKADVVIINLRTTRYGPARDPINALVEYGSGADVETVIVNGEIVIDKGRSTRID